jgi:tetratricopeptide (TPR) repeat protein
MSTSAAKAGTIIGAAILLAFGAAGLRADDLATGISLYQQGKFAEAEKHFRSASGSDAGGYLAASLAKQRKFSEAESAAATVLKDSATNEMALAALGESLVAQKKYDDAIARMGTAIKAKADLPYAYYWRGQAYYGKKQPDRMVSDFETFLKLAPKAPEAATVQQLLAGLR